MELSELETILINSEVPRPFALTWSEDDTVVLIVENGVHIFHFCSSISSEYIQPTFRRSFIPVSPSLPLQGQVVDNKSNSYLWNLGRKDMYEMVLDPDMNTLVDKITPAGFFVKETRCRLLNNSRSYVALLTNHGSLDIYERKYRKWHPVTDLSEQWSDIIKQRCQGNAKPDFPELKRRIAKLKITCFCWPDDRLFTGHNDGSICLWLVGLNHEELSVQLKAEWQSIPQLVLVEMATLGDGQGVLVAGSMSGLVKAYQFNSTNETPYELDLWAEVDLIRPSHIRITVTQEHIEVLTVKRHVLLRHTLQMMKSTLQVATSRWRELPTTIVGLQIVHGRLVVALQNHDTYYVSDSLELELVVVPHRHKHATQFHCCGISTSRNKAVWAMISSPKVHYDTRILRDVTQLILYEAKVKRFDRLTDTSAAGMLDQIVSKYPGLRLTQLTDLMELKRMQMLVDHSITRKDFKLKTTNKVLEAKLLLWEARWLQQRQSGEEKNYTTAIADLEKVVMKAHALKWLPLLKDTELDVNSRRTFELFLRDVKLSDYLVDSQCVICNSNVILSHCRFARCSTGHQVPRCCLSLLPCGVAPQAVCQSCQAVALSYFVIEYGGRCTFCDTVLIPEVRLRANLPARPSRPMIHVDIKPM